MTIFTYPYGTYIFQGILFWPVQAPTFQRCMMAIFHNMVKDFEKVFIDNFSVFRESIEVCLQNLDKVLACYEETKLILNQEKCHFLVKEAIILVHKVSQRVLEVDKEKIKVIEKLPPPMSVKGVSSFLRHAGFYHKFIKEFSKISKPLCVLPEKAVQFNFDGTCLQAFETLKKRLIETPILTAPNQELPFELIYDASNIAMGAVLDQCKDKVFHFIYFASKTLDPAECNYTATEKEMLELVYVLTSFDPVQWVPRLQCSQIMQL